MKSLMKALHEKGKKETMGRKTRGGGGAERSPPATGSEEMPQKGSWRGKGGNLKGGIYSRAQREKRSSEEVSNREKTRGTDHTDEVLLGREGRGKSHKHVGVSRSGLGGAGKGGHPPATVAEGGEGRKGRLVRRHQKEVELCWG